jgi:hypothetical protein
VVAHRVLLAGPHQSGKFLSDLGANCSVLADCWNKLLKGYLDDHAVAREIEGDPADAINIRHMQHGVSQKLKHPLLGEGVASYGLMSTKQSPICRSPSAYRFANTGLTVAGPDATPINFGHADFRKELGQVDDVLDILLLVLRKLEQVVASLRIAVCERCEGAAWRRSECLLKQGLRI